MEATGERPESYNFTVDSFTYKVQSHQGSLDAMSAWLLTFWDHNKSHEPIILDRRRFDGRCSGPGHGGFDRKRAYILYQTECKARSIEPNAPTTLYNTCRRLRDQLRKNRLNLPEFCIMERPSKQAATAAATKREACARAIVSAQTKTMRDLGVREVLEGASLASADRQRRVQELEPTLLSPPSRKSTAHTRASRAADPSRTRRSRKSTQVPGLRRPIPIPRGLPAQSSIKGSSDASLASGFAELRKEHMDLVWPELKTLGVNGITYNFQERMSLSPSVITRLLCLAIPLQILSPR